MNKHASTIIEQAMGHAYHVCKENGIQVSDIEIEWSSIMALKLVELVALDCIEVIQRQPGYESNLSNLPALIKQNLDIK